MKNDDLSFGSLHSHRNSPNLAYSFQEKHFSRNKGGGNDRNFPEPAFPLYSPPGKIPIRFSPNLNRNHSMADD